MYDAHFGQLHVKFSFLENEKETKKQLLFSQAKINIS